MREGMVSTWKRKRAGLESPHMVSQSPIRSKMRALMLLSFCAVLLSVFQASGADSESKSHYEIRLEHDPNGSGKFFRGREIAQVMGHQAADWLERPEREEEER